MKKLSSKNTHRAKELRATVQEYRSDCKEMRRAISRFRNRICLLHDWIKALQEELRELEDRK